MNKQIEEMAKAIEFCDRNLTANCHNVKCKECRYFYSKEDCYMLRLSEMLTAKGYRKSTVVAREIFEEIVKFIFSEIPDELMPIYKAEKDFRDGVISGKREAFFKVLTHLDNHLRKKYESEGADDEQTH